MGRKIGKLRLLIIVLLTIVFISSTAFSILAKPNKNTNNTPVNDFTISANQSEDSEEEEEEEEEDGKKKEVKEKSEKNQDEESDEESEESGDEEGGNEEEEEEDHEPTEEELAAAKKALDEKTKKLEEKVAKLEDSSAIIECLKNEDNQEAVDNSEKLLEKLLEELLKNKKPLYTDLETYGQTLYNKNKKSVIANYALGLGSMHRQRPNYKKALDCLGFAKNAKPPYPGASTAYNSCFLKVYGLYIIIGIVAVIGGIIAIIVVIIKKKRKKADATNTENGENTGEIDLQKLLNESPADSSTNKETNENTLTSNNLNLEANANNLDKPLPQTNNETNSANTPNAVPQEAKQSQTTTQNLPVPAPQAKNDNVETQTELKGTDNNSSTAAPAKKVVRVVKKVRIRKDANGNSYVVSEDTSIPKDSGQEEYKTTLQEKVQSEAVRNIIKPAEKPLPPVDTQLDILWGNLSRKAMQGHIGQMARKSDSTSSSLMGSSTISGNNGFGGDNRITDIRFGDVSIDLSEESLKDDLVGKLKMLAITDSELRELFAMKNPAHIPHLIEYIMTKPEPMRLAFVAKELGNYSDPAVVDALSSLLYHEDERVVLAAIQGLETTKLPAAVIPLCPFLRSEIPLYAQAARTALSKFGAVKIMQALKDLPTFTDINLKEAGIFVLSRMKGDPVEKILKTLLNDESSSVRIQAILAMSYQKNPVYIDALREFYRIANETEKSMTRKAIVYLNGFNK